MSRKRPIIRQIAAAAVLAAAVGATAIRPAVATDLETVRNRAQALADEVSGLEHERASLVRKRGQLRREIAETSHEIAVLELQIDSTERRFAAALDEYVARARELYKAGPSDRVAMLLSARTFDEMFLLLKATSRTSRDATESLEGLLAAKESAERAQAQIDTRKQRLLSAHAEIDQTTVAIESTISQRRAKLNALTNEIEKLEEQARREAAMAALAAAQGASNPVHPGRALLDLLRPTGPADGIPKQFVGTGVAFEGVASWYGPGFEGNSTASGDVFDPSLYTAASKELPLGSWLYVTHQGQGVVVYVNDRGPYVEGRILDLSQAAAAAIGITGLGWIEAEILIKK
ncbi:MAG TPA: septal ring lytic transglycosylase RlpA family protein [Actinomycetota bacterium]|nr:septal ring lytic transglycosylase RlpA family protein [Actinomycetota bacterium]